MEDFNAFGINGLILCNPNTMSNNILKGKKGIIFGALNANSIAWKVAELCHAEGAQIVLTNAPVAVVVVLIRSVTPHSYIGTGRCVAFD